MIIKCYHPLPENGKFNCFHVITKAVSVIWNKKFYDVGSFQLSLQDNPLKTNDIIVHGENCGIVMKVEETLSGCSVYGYDLKGITKFRHIYQPKTYSGNAETIIKEIALDTLMTGKRKIEGLTIADAHLTLNDSKTWECDNINVADSLNKLCMETEVGYDVRFSESGMIFDTAIGRDMKSKLIFSRRFRNIDEITYTADNYDTYNVALTKTQTGDTETYGETGDAEGILRREGATDKDAESFLKEKAPIETIRGSANEKLQYGIDWKNGDYVTCVFKNYTTEKQIVEVKEVYEHSNCKIIPVFGEEKENIVTKILKL